MAGFQVTTEDGDNRQPTPETFHAVYVISDGALFPEALGQVISLRLFRRTVDGEVRRADDIEEMIRIYCGPILCFF